jgi:ribulose-5-phosphate 4-epimerase/fuculose-1-phosphate aldolase
MKEAIAQLVQASRACGGDLRYVQGGGGNVSVKAAAIDRLVVKASGGLLRDVSPTAGWVELGLSSTIRLTREHLERLAAQPDFADEIADEAQSALGASPRSPGTAQPSLETFMHVLFAQQAVVHTHPAAVVALGACGAALQAQVEQALGLPLHRAAYGRPGLRLAAEVDRSVPRAARSEGQAVVLLERHGLLCAAPEAEQAVRLHHDVVRRTEEALGDTPYLDVRLEVAACDAPDGIELSLGDRLFRVTPIFGNGSRPETAEAAVAVSGPMAPDFAVYCGARGVAAEAARLGPAAREYHAEWGLPPKLFIPLEDGAWRIAARGESGARAAAEVLLAQLQTLAILRRHGVAPTFLDRSETARLMNWAPEKRRREMLAGGERRAEEAP